MQKKSQIEDTYNMILLLLNACDRQIHRVRAELVIATGYAEEEQGMTVNGYGFLQGISETMLKLVMIICNSLTINILNPIELYILKG